MTSVNRRRYPTAAKGTEALEDAFNYWTGKVTDLTFQSSIALIAANWALVSGIHPTGYARFAMIVSIIAALASLLVGLWGARHMAMLHDKQFSFATQNREAWQQQWEQSETPESQWPYTQQIEDSGKWFSATKFWLLVLAGVTFVIGAGLSLL